MEYLYQALSVINFRFAFLIAIPSFLICMLILHFMRRVAKKPGLIYVAIWVVRYCAVACVIITLFPLLKWLAE